MGYMITETNDGHTISCDQCGSSFEMKGSRRSVLIYAWSVGWTIFQITPSTKTFCSDCMLAAIDMAVFHGIGRSAGSTLDPTGLLRDTD